MDKSYDIRLVINNGETNKYVAFGNNKQVAIDSVMNGFKISKCDIKDIYIGIIK